MQSRSSSVLMLWPALLPAAITASLSPSLETLAFYYGTDKSHDDHKYSDVYASLFDPIRDRVRNVTEIGLAQGQSLQVWHDYFHSAQIWGIDIMPSVIGSVQTLFAGVPRVQTFLANSKNAEKVRRLGLAAGSMDVIIDDGDHYPPVMEKTLQVMWPYLRVGGYYIIEDIATGANRNGQRYGARKRNAATAWFYPPGYAPLVHNASFVSEATRQLLQQHDVFFVDPLVGHRAPEKLIRSLGLWMKDLVNHGSHLLVIRRRATPRTRPVSMALAERRAMWKGGVRPLRDWTKEPPATGE